MPNSSTGYLRWRRLLFRFEPETAHRLSIAALRCAQLFAPTRRLLSRGRRIADPRLAQSLLGTTFPGPVGLAAGFDKDGLVLPGMAALGFGSIEVGTVTPRPQPGNPRPRLFRHPRVESLQNSMGFNNRGAAALASRLAWLHPFRVPVGVNLGRNRDTPAERAAEDYLGLVERFTPLCDYLVVNVSSPNTPGLRDLQRPETVGALVRDACGVSRRPLLVKLSPDLADAAAIEVAEAAVDAGAAGVVLTNTTTDYSLIPGAGPPGGLSGAVLAPRSYGMLAAVARRLFGRCLLISVGGIDSAAEAYRRLRAGASLVQLYTGLVYRGPGLAARIHRGLGELLERDGLDSLEQCIGADV